MRAFLIGGPLDGRRLELRSKKPFLWVDTRPPHKCFVCPGKHRVLYRYEGVGRYVIAQHTHALCGGCGCYHETMEQHITTCSLCGGALTLR